MLYTHEYWGSSDEADTEFNKAMTYLKNYVTSIGGTITDKSGGVFNSYGDYYVRVDVK